MRQLLFLVILIFSPATGVEIYGQFSVKPFVQNFSKETYKAENQNWSVSTTEDGLVYIGNNKGLLKFDGINWSLYPMPEDMAVRSVAVGMNDRVYVGAYEEFGYFEEDAEGSFIYHSLNDYTVRKHLHNDEIWRIIHHKNKVYFQSFSNIFVFDGSGIHILDPQGTIVLLIEARGRLFVHKVDSGLLEIVNDELLFIEGSQILADDEIKAILPFGDNDFLVGASGAGFYLYNGTDFMPWESSVNSVLKNVEINNAIATDSFLVIGSIIDGIFILDRKGKLREHLNTSNFLQNNTVLSLASDNRQNIWTGLDRGLDYVDFHLPIDFYMDQSSSLRTVYDAVYKDNSLWVGTNQGVFKYEFYPYRGFGNPEFIEGSQGQVWDMTMIDGQLFCGHTNGTFIIEGQSFRKVSDINGGFEIHEVTRNKKEYLVQSTYSAFCIYEKSDEKWVFSHNMQGFYEPVPHFEFDHLGNIWATHTHKGLFLLKPNSEFEKFNSIRYFGKEDGFPTDRKIEVAKVDDRIVFCTRKSIYTYDDLNDTIVPYDFLNEKLGNYRESNRIIGFENNFYWCVLKNKVALFFISGPKVEMHLQFDFERQGASLSMDFPSISRLMDDVYLVCLDRGFAIYKDEIQNAKTILPSLSMRSVYVFNKNAEKKIQNLSDTKKEFPFALRNIRFTFSPLVISPSPLFRFRLLGLDEVWDEWGRKSEVVYTRLPPGDYVFQVETAGIEGEQSTSLSYSFKILRPWYTSWFAIVIYIFLFLTGIVIARIAFLRRLKIHTLRLKAIQDEKRRRDKIINEQEIIRLANEKLQAEIGHKSIQLANYTMTILRKNELLTRIKEEISRQKDELGGRYPNFHYERLLKLIDASISSEDDWKIFEMHFDQAHENFFKRLMAKYPEITPSDLRLCAYLKLNLSTKEIAPLLNISIRGVEIRRYRLRQRLNLPKEKNLIEFLLNF